MGLQRKEAHTGELGVADYVFFVGSVNNVQDYYAASMQIVTLAAQKGCQALKQWHAEY